ncbi:SRPBCC family protein [Phormidesmis priestleyi]|nr:SRPBCC family protein [Phormidesmis priestleyi]
MMKMLNLLNRVNFPFKFLHRKRRRLQYTLARTYQTISTASVDDVWKKIIDLADVSWHPLLSSTNLPHGLVAKPGLIYEAMTRLGPFPIRIFVERVDDKSLLSVRILALPGIEERVTYEIKSSVLGTCVSYSVTLQGWLSPLVWSLTKPYAARVASDLAQAVEHPIVEPSSPDRGCFDF